MNTTPRDFVKQDSTLTMRQHCESFLDTLAAKGATDTVFLFEELLEAFPVGRATAILILWDWQEKRAPPTQCQHGQLARQCLLCEQAAEIERLRAEIMREAETWEPWNKWFLEMCAEVSRLRAEFPLLDDEGLDEETHHCEWSIQQDRKRLHAILDALAAKGE